MDQRDGRRSKQIRVGHFHKHPFLWSFPDDTTVWADLKQEGDHPNRAEVQPGRARADVFGPLMRRHGDGLSV